MRFRWLSRFSLTTFSLLIVMLGSCDDSTSPAPPIYSEPGLYVLNEGSFSDSRSASLMRIEEDQSISPNVYQSSAGEYLGGLANHMGVFENRLYIVVQTTGRVVIVNLTDMAKAGEIDLGQRNPREIVFSSSGRAFVSCYDGSVAVIPPASMTVETYLTVGEKPDALLIHGDELFVACGGWGSDNRIFSFNTNDLSPVDTLLSGYNVVALAVFGEFLFSGSLPVWGRDDITAGVFRMPLADRQQMDSLTVIDGVSQLSAASGQLLMQNGRLYRVDEESLDLLLLAEEMDHIVYGLFIDADGSVWTSEYPKAGFDQPGRVGHRTSDGILRSSYAAGIGPKTILRIN
jgi:hypothetical protein